ncbi:MAG: SH3 domain-containing protein [Treponema sp.]|nr:SH3 domain-containing protein [Candidatus Treponema merdequi]
MKKRIWIFVLMLASSVCFGQKFERGDYAYVDASSGLRVRDAANLNAKKIDVVYDRMKVQILEVGPEVTIDGISSNWIRILLPVKTIENTRTESGWVFGGYLSSDLKPFSVEGWTDQDLILYLCRFQWHDGNWNFSDFYPDGKCSSYKPESSFGGNGTFSVSMKDKSIDVTNKYWDDSEEWEKTVTTHYSITMIEEDYFAVTLNGEYLIYEPSFYTYPDYFNSLGRENVELYGYDRGWINVLCYEFGQRKLKEFASERQVGEYFMANCNKMGIVIE